MARPQLWRLVQQDRSAGTYYHLTKGKKDPINLILGYVTAEQAAMALAKISEHLENDDEERVLSMYRTPMVASATSWGAVGDADADAESGGDTSGRALVARYLTWPDTDWERVFGVSEQPIDYKRMSVAEYFDRVYWPARCDTAGPTGASPRTQAMERGIWRQLVAKQGILDGPIGAVRMGKLDDQTWEQWVYTLKVSPRTMLIRRNAYAKLLNHAARCGHIEYTPKFFTIKGSSLTTKEKSDPLSVAEVRALIAASSGQYAAMWAVGCGLGLRPSELVSMHWEDVSWDRGVLAVRGTKTEGSKAVIPMTPLARDGLRTLWMALGQPAAGLCFTHRGRDILCYKKRLAADAAKAGITQKVYPYLLRSTFATIACAIGISKDLTRTIGRWTSEKMLDEVYNRPRPQDLVGKLASFTF